MSFDNVLTGFNPAEAILNVTGLKWKIKFTHMNQFYEETVIAKLQIWNIKGHQNQMQRITQKQQSNIV